MTADQITSQVVSPDPSASKHKEATTENSLFSKGILVRATWEIQEWFKTETTHPGVTYIH